MNKTCIPIIFSMLLLLFSTLVIADDGITTVKDDLGQNRVSSSDDPDIVYELCARGVITKIYQTPLDEDDDISARMLLCPNDQKRVCIEVTIDRALDRPSKYYPTIENLVVDYETKSVYFERTDYLKVKCGDIHNGHIVEYKDKGCSLRGMAYMICSDRTDDDCLEYKRYGAVWLETLF